MARENGNLIPKVHPATRPVEPEDPMSLHATAVAGDPEVMLRCMVQEYAWMGWDAQQILSLFLDLNYPVLHHLLHLYGERGIRGRIATVLAQTGVFCCQTTVREELEAAESEPELIQLGVRKLPNEAWKEEHHAEGL